jgi:hypothetical protein
MVRAACSALTALLFLTSTKEGASQLDLHQRYHALSK